MSKYHSFYDTVDQIITYGIDKQILHLNTDDYKINGTLIHVKGRKLINFGSCSYLGLEFDWRVKLASIKAVETYGTQFSSSRAYISLGLYHQLEKLMQQIFNAYCIITPTTTLGHIANIPVMVEDEDAVIMDQQVHNSVQTAVQIIKARGVHTELVRHNRMDLLEERIKQLRNKHKKIWYMADGIYSMFGDSSPVDTVYKLMEQYPELHYYVDDAHGMSIHGTHGRGFILKSHDIHFKMVVATSLNKAFASGGGVLVYGNRELGRKVNNVGGPLLSSGPMQPSGLGAAIASACIHLNGEIYSLQEQLKKNIQFTIELLKKYQLPLLSEPGAAIFFIAVSLPRLGHNMVRRMMDKGYYLNLGIFPTVPMKQTGLRFTITRLHTFREIKKMISVMADELKEAMEEEQITLSEIYKAFKRPVPPEFSEAQINPNKKSSLLLSHYTTIEKIEVQTWNNIFQNQGAFDHNNLKLLEKCFSENELPEDNWKFDYLLVKNSDEKIVAATFLTTTTWKDDLLSPEIISRQVEKERVKDPYYLTSTVLSSGSLITEGNHFYYDKTDPGRKEALELIFQKINLLQEQYEANQIVLRDFHEIDPELDALMVDHAFFRINMPPTHAISLSSNKPENFYTSLSVKSQNHLRRHMMRNAKNFKVDIIQDSLDENCLDTLYTLYLNVKNKNLDLNTFPLPKQFFYFISKDPSWEIITLRLNLPEISTAEPICMVCCYTSPEVYMPVVIGIDYTYNQHYDVYRQALYQVVLRAQQLDKQKIQLGFSATTEKKKLGARVISTYAYTHTKDTYQIETLASLSLIAGTIKDSF